MDATHLRLLPWAGPEGKPCFLSSDGHGRLSRLADDIEASQLGTAVELLGHAEAMLGDPKAGSGELRFLSSELTEALRDIVRVAESRGARLPVTGNEGDDESAEGGEEPPVSAVPNSSEPDIVAEEPPHPGVMRS
ncbi:MULTISPECIES: hypothetical protein [unclassified Streptomyces]|uniref:hypothetical protein n=1 Tax=unclassified Streptomyces TaxID=2593676 RepID=UPI00341B1A99